MLKFLKKATPQKTTFRAEKVQQGINSQEARNESVEQHDKHKKVDFKLGKLPFFKLKMFIEFLGKLVKYSLIYYILAYFVPLRDILPNFYVWVDTILKCFDSLFSLLNYLFSLLGHLFSLFLG